MLRVVVVLCVLISSDRLSAQDFRLPLEIPLELSGNFGELRTNHFHTGIDIRTGGKSGLKVVAAESGYVSRIRVSERGYGKALYITHPGGIVSVYAHLQSFNDSLASYVKSEQIRMQSFAVDLYPEPFRFRVGKGEVVGLSGNSGSSAGPHLHFELRNQFTENPLNPLNYGYSYPDNHAPEFQAITIHPVGDSSWAGTGTVPFTLPVSRKGNSYAPTQPEIAAGGQVGISVKTTDRANLAGYTLGLYRLSVFANNNRIFEALFDSLSFESNRAINSYIDYNKAVCGSGEKFQKTWLPDNSLLFNLTTGNNRGLIAVPKDSLIRIRIEAADHAGNVSLLEFSIRGKALPFNNQRIKPLGTEKLSAQDVFVFHKKDIWIQVPPQSVYNDLDFLYSTTDTFPDGVTRMHQVHDHCVPLHNNFNIMLRIPEHLTGSDRIVAVRTANGKTEAVYSGSRMGGMFHTSVNSFGTYYLTEDNKAPEITLQQATGGLTFSVADNLSGIGRYDLFIEDVWHLSEYDPRTRIITADTGILRPGTYKYKLLVFDNAGNMAKREGVFRK